MANLTSVARKKNRNTTNPHRTRSVEKIVFDEDNRLPDSKSYDDNHLQRGYKRFLRDEVESNQLDSKSRFANEDVSDIELSSKRRKIATESSQEQLYPHQGLLRAGSRVSGGTSRPDSEIKSSSIRRISNFRAPADGDGFRPLFGVDDEGGGLEPTYDVGHTRRYLRSYMTYIYPLCPLEICNDSVEDLVIDTLRKTGSSRAQQSNMTILCVYVMLALGE